MTGTSAPVAVAETVLSASFGTTTTAQAGGPAVNLTVQAQTTGGALVPGYQGTIAPTSLWNSVSDWGPGTNPFNGDYTFTTSDAGSHTFSIKFRYAGTQTVTWTDTTQPTRAGTSGPITVIPAPAGNYSHGAAPAALQLPDGSVIWAFTAARGRLYVRRNVGTPSEQAWRPLTQIVDAQNGLVGADTPSFAYLGSTLALFYSYTDGTYFQVWETTSTDNGTTWSAPVQLTHDQSHVQRIQAYVSNGTAYLFWSRQDTDGKLFYETSSDLVTWSAAQQVGEQIGPLVSNTTSNFGIARLASGTWVLGWIGPNRTTNPPTVTTTGSTYYPTVQVATSADLTTWTTPQELTLADQIQGQPSVALGPDPSSGTLWALFDESVAPSDTYIFARTSADGLSWTAQTAEIYDHSQPADGHQGYTAGMPTIVAQSSSGLHQDVAHYLSASGGPGCSASSQAGNGSVTPPYGHNSWENPDSGQTPQGGCGGGAGAPGSGNPAGGGTPPIPISGQDPPSSPPPGQGNPQTPPSPATSPCASAGDPVDVVTGIAHTSATDLVAAALGEPLQVSRSYNSWDGVNFLDSSFGYGWSWCYGTHAVILADGSVAVVEGSGARTRFWKNGSSFTGDVGVYDTLVAGQGGGYVLTRHDQTVWTFNSAGQLVSIADRNGNTQTLGYTNGVISSVTAPGGRALTITTDGNAHITAIAGPGGLHTSYTYDGNGNLATATDAGGSTTTFGYDTRHELTTITDANHHTQETNTYGSLGRVTQQLDALNHATTFFYPYQSYAGSPNPSGWHDPRGYQTNLANDAFGHLTQRQDFKTDGSTLLAQQQFSYDSQGNVLTAKDPNGRSYSYTYDARGNVLTATADQGGLNLTTTYTYNSTNDLLTVTDPLNHVTSYSYDTRGNLLTATVDPGGLNLTTTYTYDASTGELLTVADPTQRTLSFGYNTAGDLTTVTEPGPVTTTYGYDGAGRLTSVTDPLNHTSSLTLDGLGRILTITDALNHTATFGYDAGGVTPVWWTPGPEPDWLWREST